MELTSSSVNNLLLRRFASLEPSRLSEKKLGHLGGRLLLKRFAVDHKISLGLVLSLSSVALIIHNSYFCGLLVSANYVCYKFCKVTN